MTGSNYRPNPAQEEAVAHGSGPLRLLAGAGSGKTTTLVRRIQRLIEAGLCRPGELLMLTFTTKAVADMRRKVAEALPPGSEQPRIETYHAFALSLVQEFAPEVGLPPEPVLLTEGPVKLFARRHADRLGLRSMDLSRLEAAIATALDFFSWHRHEGTYLQEEAALLAKLPPEGADFLRELLTAHRQWRALLAEQGAADYDDLIALSVALLEEHPAVRQTVQARYRYLLVDEYQDTDYLQSRFMRQLAGEEANITIVGDPDQTIYSFRGAAVSNILRFEREYPGVRSIPMVTNYRSTPAIVAAANAVIAENQRRKEEPLKADREQGDLPRPQLIGAPDWIAEARWMAAEMQRLHAAGTAWRQMTVLVRANKHKLPLYAALLEAGIPALVVGGMDLFADAETARFIAYLRSLAAPDSDGDLSVALTLPRYGLTDDDIARLGRDRRSGERLLDVVARRSVADPTLKAFLDEFWPLYRIQHAEGCEAAIRGALGLHAGSLGLQARLNADQLLPLARSFFAQAHLLADPTGVTPPLGLFCQYLLSLREIGEPPEGVSISEEEDAVRLMTVHAAKGLEFPVLFLPRLTDRDFHPKGRRKWEKPFPLAWHHDPELAANLEQFSVEEERRLFYVALTRAMDRLYLSWAPVDPARKRPVGPSGFLAELGETVDRVALPGGQAEGPAAGGVRVPPRAEEAVGEVAAAVDATGMAGGDATGSAGVHATGTAGVHATGSAGVDLSPLVSKAPARPLPQPEPGAPYRPKPPAVLSFSHLSTYQFCPYRFFLQYILRLPGRPAPAADAGVRIHTAIERLAEARETGQPVAFDQFAAWAAAPPLPADGDATGAEEPESDEPYPPADEATALQHYWASEYGQTPALASEQEFYIRLGGAVVRGFIDRIHRRPDGQVEVVDFKTYNHLLSEEEVRRSLQMPLYIRACREALGLPQVETAAMYFLKHDKTVRVRYTEAELAERLGEAERLVDAIQAGDFAPTPGKGCTYCPYGEICPVSELR